ncbi:MAG: WYL domain-containing protein [Bacteroidetes bacterium]|nr:MAG: WYL domain-containing protein [Bacteroidota bacterium]TAG86757.1 MAG: WYL domain-containing protein [Bacteroidota bacterium]
MAENNKKKEQIKTILDLFNKKESISAKELKKNCNIEERQLKYYLQAIRDEHHINIEYNKKINEYVKKDNAKGNLIDSLYITNKEITAFENAISTLKSLKDLPLFSDLSELFDKLKDTIQFRYQSQTKEIIEFENVPLIKGTDLIMPIWERIKEEKVIEIRYKKFDDKEENYVLHPYQLKEYQNRWYVIGLENSKNDLRILALDRIEEITNSWDVKYIKNTTDLKKIFYHSFGLYLNTKQQTEKIILEFSSKRAKYLKTQAFHPQQSETKRILKDDENGLTIQFDLKINDELIMKLASFGSDVKIISPQNLQTKLKQYLEPVIKMYQ